MAKVKFSHGFRAKKEDEYIKANELVEMTEARADEAVENIKRDFNVDVTYEVVESDQKDQGDNEVNLEKLELPELKELADERGIEYAKNANAEKMIELLEE